MTCVNKIRFTEDVRSHGTMFEIKKLFVVHQITSKMAVDILHWRKLVKSVERLVVVERLDDVLFSYCHVKGSFFGHEGTIRHARIVRNDEYILK